MVNGDAVAVGVDFGGTRIKLGLVDGAGRVTARGMRETPRGRGPEPMLDSISGAVEELLQGQGVAPEALHGVGLGTPGPLDARSERVLLAPNIPGWEGVPLKKILQERLRLPVHLENDANAAALGEYWVGAGREVESLIYLGLGTGVGGGIVLNGEVWRGSHGAGAELGHVTVDPGGEACGCGNRGCLETLASGRTITRAARRAVELGEAPLLAETAAREGGDLSPELVARAAREGDPTAKRIYAEAGRWLGVAVGGFLNIFDPDMVVIGGGVAASAELFLPYVREEARRRSFAVIHEKVEVVTAQLGDDAGVVGAVAPFFLPRR